ncbi:MAG: monofunctional biosynthetic peptidoglycan transglycosylase [Ectothiorhodospiraceae bacterium]|jgi:monofunctional biosynthetic peptidoglycan transglycosylase
MIENRRRPWRTALRAAGWVVLLFVVGTTAMVAALRWVDPPTSAFMIRHAIVTDTPPRHHWVDRTAVSDWAALAVIASEDQRFPNHHGFDLGAIAEALKEYDRGEGLRGASTISQQVAKNLFLWPGRNFIRKGLEAWFTVLIELFWSKGRILEVYLNVAQFGPDTFGVGTASSEFFGISAARLDRYRAALLAAVLPNPDDLHAAAPSDYLIQRQYWILRQMRSLGGRSYLPSSW